jgi:hypothetical protein
MLVKLPPGGNRDNALKALERARELALQLLQQDGPLNPPKVSLAQYLDWVDQALYLLRYHVSSADLESLVLTRRYWALENSAHPSTSMSPDGAERLVATELEEREHGIGLAAQRLRERIERWPQTAVYLVPDTSFFVHHSDKLEDVDFAGGILHIREEPVRLLVPMVVVDELDDLKQSKDKHLRWRARHTLAVLDRLLRNPTEAAELRPPDYTPLGSGGLPRGQVTIEVLVDARGHVRLPINDDEIVDQAVSVQVLAGCPVTLLTFDTGQSMRARAAGIRCIKIEQPAEDGQTAALPS